MSGYTVFFKFYIISVIIYFLFWQNIAEYERLVSQLQAKLSEKEAMVEHLNGQVQLSMITSNNERSLLIQRVCQGPYNITFDFSIFSIKYISF